jgi:hypothetical protein
MNTKVPFAGPLEQHHIKEGLIVVLKMIISTRRSKDPEYVDQSPVLPRKEPVTQNETKRTSGDVHLSNEQGGVPVPTWSSEPVTPSGILLWKESLTLKKCWNVIFVLPTGLFGLGETSKRTSSKGLEKSIDSQSSPPLSPVTHSSNFNGWQK